MDDLWIKEFVVPGTDSRKATHFHYHTNSYLTVSPDKIVSFWLKYGSSKDKMCIAEFNETRKTQQLSFDIKLLFDQQDDEDIYTILLNSIEDFIQYLIMKIQNLINQYYNIDINKGAELLACYLTDTKTRFHNNIYIGKLVFPYMQISKVFFKQFYHYLIGDINKDPMEWALYNPINSIDSMIKITGDTYNYLYGSPDIDGRILTLDKLYGQLSDDDSITPIHELVNVFYPTLHDDVIKNYFPTEMLTHLITDNGLEFFLPMFFSNGFYTKECPRNITSTEVSPNINTLTQKSPSVATISALSLNDTDNLQTARRYLLLMKSSRVTVEWSWSDIGQALYSINSEEEGLKLFKWFTSQGNTLFKTDDDCEDLWLQLDKTSGVNIETLQYFAMLDEPKKYEQMREEIVRTAICRAITTLSHTTVADAFYLCYPHEFICAFYETSVWYYYSGHRWIATDGISTIMKYLVDKFMPKLEALRIELSQMNYTSRDTEMKRSNENMITAIGDLIKKISNDSFKKSICSELRIKYKKDDVDFFGLADSNPYYMAMPNGIIDLRGGKPVFRPGKPQDYITLCTRHNYRQDFNPKTKIVIEVMQYFEQVFRNEGKRRYFWNLLSSLLLSGNSNKIFPIFSGRGNNSKSMLVSLIHRALGSYSVTLPTSLITGKEPSADKPTPALVYSKGAKVAWLAEPNKEDPIKSGTVKGLTGKDSYFVRDLFQKGKAIREIQISMLIVLICNDIPNFDDTQEAIWERVRKIVFDSVWQDNAPESKQEQFERGIFKKDINFDSQREKMCPALLWIMIQNYENYHKNGLQEPDIITKDTLELKIANNIFIAFMKENLEQVVSKDKTLDTNVSITVNEMFSAFKRWYVSREYSAKAPNQDIFKDNMQRIIGKNIDFQKKWYGYRLIEAAQPKLLKF